MKKLILALTCLFFAIPCTARTIIVKADGSGDYPTIQAAINDANNGDTVVLQPGIYAGDGDRNIDFLGKAIAVRSTDPYDPNVVASTVIYCQGHRGFYIHQNEGLDSILSGLTITNGSQNPGNGGGIYIRNSSPSISYCRILNSYARDYGGGICCSAYSNPVITHCTIMNNSAYFNGGGIAVTYGCEPIISHCVIMNNVAGAGGGILISDTPPYPGVAKVDHCIIRDNNADKGPEIYTTYDISEIEYCNIKGGYPGTGNIDVDPCFVDPGTGNYHLLANSLCIDSGDPNYMPIMFLESDFDGESRVMGIATDMGIDEFTSVPANFIEVSATILEFEANEGKQNPEPQILRIGSWGTINWEVSEDCPWLEVDPNTGGSTGEINEVILSVDITGLTVGTYNCELVISDPNAANSPQTVDVNLIVHGVLIGLSTNEILFRVPEGPGGPNPPDQIFTVRNSGAFTLNWEITYDCNWLTVNPVSGSSTGEPNEVTLSVDIMGLAAGEYHCSLTISDPNAENSPQTVAVTLSTYIPCFFPTNHPDYDQWVEVGCPPCWCYSRQCHGDTDDTMEYIAKKGYYYAHFKDLNLLLAAWNVREPPEGPGIKWPDPKICADFAHNKESICKCGYYRVHFKDLNILLNYWNVREPPDGPGIEPNCLDVP